MLQTQQMNRSQVSFGAIGVLANRFLRLESEVWNNQRKKKMEKKPKERRPEMKMLMRQSIRKTPTREKQEQFQGKGRQR